MKAETAAVDPQVPGPPAEPTMFAMEYDQYGGAEVLHVGERPVPQRLPGQVMIAVHASSVNPVDYRIRRGEMKALLLGGFPRVPGFDVAGVIVDAGGDGHFRQGDRVMAFLDDTRGGACAEFAVCAIDSVAKIPESMSMAEAAAIPLAGSTALQSLRDHGGIEPGKRVLINGASGGVGGFAVQIAKAYGCQVDAVASGENEAYCLALGADHFIDYYKVDFADSESKWDLIFDAAGKSGFWEARAVLHEGGRYVSTEPDIKGVLMSLFTWPFSKSGTVMLAKPRADDLRELISLYEQGKLKVTIDRRYATADAADAHRRVEQGVERGKVVLLNHIKHAEETLPRESVIHSLQLEPFQKHLNHPRVRPISE